MMSQIIATEDYQFFFCCGRLKLLSPFDLYSNSMPVTSKYKLTRDLVQAIMFAEYYSSQVFYHSVWHKSAFVSVQLLSKREKAFPKVSSENRVLKKSEYPITQSQGMVLMKI